MASKRLEVIIAGNAAGAKKAFGEVSSAGGDTEKKVSHVGRNIGLAIGAIGAAAGAVAKKSADTFKTVGGEVAKMSRFTGLGAEAASRLRVAFQLTGVDGEKAGRAIGAFSKNLDKGKLDGYNHSLAGQKATAKKVQAATEKLATAQERLSDLQHAAKPNLKSIETATKKVADIQRRLTELQDKGSNAMGNYGIKTRDATGHLLPIHDLLLKVSDQFKKMPDGAEKTALAVDLFGKAGADLIPFLNKGAEGIKELEKQSDKFGTTLSGKDVAAVKESTKQHRLFTLGMEGLQVQIGRYVLPIINKLVGFLAERLPGAVTIVRTVIKSAHDFIVPIFQALTGAVGDFVGSFSTAGEDVGKSGLAEKVKDLGDKIQTTLNIARVHVVTFLDSFKAGKATQKDNVLAQTAEAGANFRVELDKIVKWCKDHLPEIKKRMVDSFGWVVDNAKTIAVAVAAIVAGYQAFDVVGSITPMIELMNAAISANPYVAAAVAIVAIGVALVYAYNHFKGFRDVVDGVIDWLQKNVMPAMDAVGRFFVRVWADVVGWVQKHWDAIKQIIGIGIALVRNIIMVEVNYIKLGWKLFGDSLIAIAMTVWKMIRGVVQGAINVIAGIVRFVMAIIHGEWGAAWDAIKQTAAGVWQIILALIQGALGLIVGVLKAAAAVISFVWNAIWGAVSATVQWAFGLVSGYVSGGIDTVVGVVTSVGSAISDAWASIWGGITGVVSSVWDTVSGVVVNGINGIINMINDMIHHVNAVTSKIPLFGSSLHIGDIPTIGRPRSTDPFAKAASSYGSSVRGKMHTGGTFHAPRAGGEGLALLRDGEHVTPPGRGGGSGITVIVQGSILSKRDLVGAIAEAQRRRVLTI